MQVHVGPRRRNLKGFQQPIIVPMGFDILSPVTTLEQTNCSALFGATSEGRNFSVFSNWFAGVIPMKGD
jgi:hypothetical protein